MTTGGGGEPSRPPHGQEAAEEQLGRPGVGAVVDAVDVVAEPHLEPHRDHQGDDEQPGEQPAATDLHDAPDDGREEQVELLLDRQRPEVLQGARGGEEVGVAGAGEVEAPVRHVGEGAEHVGPQAVELLGAADAPPDEADEGDRHEGGGQETAEAAGPEPAEGDRARRVELADQQVGDQEPREGEEGGDAEEAALGPGEAAVEQQHADDGQATEAVEAEQVRHPLAPQADLGGRGMGRRGLEGGAHRVASRAGPVAGRGHRGGT